MALDLFTEQTSNHADNMNPIIEQVNENTSAIGQLSNKSFIPRGDLSIVLGTKDLNQAKTEGGYLCVETEAIKYINKPPLIGWFTLLIYLGGTGAVFQEAIQHDGVRMSRHFDGVNWSPWKEIATTDKIEIPVPYNVGYAHDSTFEYASKIIVNKFKQARIYFNVKKLNNETFKVNEEFAVATLPDSYKARFWVAGACTSSHSTICKNNCVIFSNFLFVRCLTESVAITGYLDYEVV